MAAYTVLFYISLGLADDICTRGVYRFRNRRISSSDLNTVVPSVLSDLSLSCLCQPLAGKVARIRSRIPYLWLFARKPYASTLRDRRPPMALSHAPPTSCPSSCLKQSWAVRID